MSARRSGASRTGDAAPLHRATSTRSGARTATSARPRKAPPRRGRSFVSLDLRDTHPALRWTVGIAFGLVLVIALALLADVTFTQGVIHPGVSVAGVEVGGLAPAAAQAKLVSTVGKRYGSPIVLVSGTKQWKRVPTEMGATFDATSTVTDAFSVGRRNGWVGSLSERLGAWVSPVAVPARTAVDADRFNTSMNEVAQVLRRLPTDSTVVVRSDGTLKVTESKSGRELQHARANSEILAAMPRNKNRVVALRVIVRPPGVDERSAAAAAAIGKVMISRPAVVSYGSKKWTLTPAMLASALQFGVVPAARASDPYTLVPQLGTAGPAEDSLEATVPVALGAYFSDTKLTSALGSGLEALGRPATDARFEVSGNTVKLVPSQVGLGPDIRTLARDLTGSLRTATGARTVSMKLGQALPEFTTEKARAMGVKELLATFTTEFNPDNGPRTNNIKTLAKAIDGSLVPPGGTWSLNGRVGERTAAKGYAEANAIVNGKLVPQLGGGICQVATTVFNAIFFSGEPVIERQNHSFYISHYPKGRDATVNWGGTDLRFKNDTSSYILIKTNTNTSSGAVTVSLYGTKPGYTVTYETGQLKQTTTGYPSDTIDDSRLAVGEKVVKDPGLPGYKIVVTRIVRRNGSLVRKDEFVSDYSPKTEILLVGTMRPDTPTGSGSTTKTAN